MNLRVIVVLLIAVIIVFASIFLLRTESNNISALEYLDIANSIIIENYSSEYHLSGIGAEIDNNGMSTMWEYSFWFNNGSMMGEIWIKVCSNNSFDILEKNIFPYNQTMWNSILNDSVITQISIDSDQAVDIIEESGISLSAKAEKYIICREVSDISFWSISVKQSDNSIDYYKVDAVTGAIIE